jgi:hypothetical protein
VPILSFIEHQNGKFIECKNHFSQHLSIFTVENSKISNYARTEKVFFISEYQHLINENCY